MTSLLLLPYLLLITNPLEPLVKIINKGYDKPRFTYGIIQTARVKTDFITDLQMRPGSLFALLVAADVGQRPPLVASTGAEDINTWDVLGPFASEMEVRVVIPEEWSDTMQALERVVATIGLKPYSGSAMEVTAFTAFQKGAGKALLARVETLVRDPCLVGCLGIARDVCLLVTSVIAEHNLVGYYEKAGYTTDQQILIEPSAVMTNSTTLEDGVQAARAFTLTYMHKDIATSV